MVKDVKEIEGMKKADFYSLYWMVTLNIMSRSPISTLYCVKMVQYDINLEQKIYHAVQEIAC